MLCRILNIPLYVTRPLRLLTALTHALDVLIKCFYEFSVNHVVFLWIFCIFLETELTGHAPLHSLLWNHRTLGELFAITNSIYKCFFWIFVFFVCFFFLCFFLDAVSPGIHCKIVRKFILLIDLDQMQPSGSVL